MTQISYTKDHLWTNRTLNLVVDWIQQQQTAQGLIPVCEEQDRRAVVATGGKNWTVETWQTSFYLANLNFWVNALLVVMSKWTRNSKSHFQSYWNHVTEIQAVSGQKGVLPMIKKVYLIKRPLSECLCFKALRWTLVCPSPSYSFLYSSLVSVR